MIRMKSSILFLTILCLAAWAVSLPAQSLDIPSPRWGVSFGNSRNFTGLRFNFRDRDVGRIRGINITLWQPYDKEDNDSVIEGLSLGLIPGVGTLKGIQIGVLGVAGMKDVRGFSYGLLGVGSGGSMIGLNVGGLGAGAGEDVIGLNIGGLGMGAGRDVVGINLGGLGLGAGRNMTGINIGGIGLGAGEKLSGLNIGGLGVGAGDLLEGVTLAGLAAGSVEVRGLVVAGLAAGGKYVRGVLAAGGCNLIVDGGELKGAAIASVNWFKGQQNGLAVGIVNYTWSLKGVQIGLVNIVRDNPRGRRVLPFVNWN